MPCVSASTLGKVKKPMLRYFLSIVMSLAIVTNALAMSPTDGQFFFRYKSGFMTSTNPSTSSKDITAYYIGGVGEAFSEILPMKPQWEDDNWVITSGTLPTGISFDSATRTFSGTPSSPIRGNSVELTGYDVLGNEVATAAAHFDIFTLPANRQTVDLYAHTGKFYNKSLSLPAGVVVHRWDYVVAPPPGVTYNGRYIDGTPGEAGYYKILNIGYDFNNNAIFAYMGDITVEDGPTFPNIPDDLREVSRMDNYGCGIGSECAYWYRDALPTIRNSISDASKVKYAYEVENAGSLPSGLNIAKYYTTSTQLFRMGRVYNFYDQARVRLKAVDTDGTIGYSNWFNIGTTGPKEVCLPENGQTEISLFGVVDEQFLGKGYRVPVGLYTTGLNFALSGNQLPQSLALDQATGLISGIPSAEEVRDGVFVTVSNPTVAGFEDVVCGPYKFQIDAAPVSFKMSGDQYAYHTGSDMNVTFQADGAVLPGATAELVADQSNLPPEVQFAYEGNNTWSLKGKLATIGEGYTGVVRFTNGNGTSLPPQATTFDVVGPLAVDDVAGNLLQIKQFDLATSPEPIHTFTYQNAIGLTTVEMIGGLQGLDLSYDELVGGTTLAPGSYGPFKVRVTDATGAMEETDAFTIEVLARAGLTALETVEPVFTLKKMSGGVSVFSVSQEPLAGTVYTVKYSISPATLPPGIWFSDIYGQIGGTPEEVDETGPYVVTATEYDSAGVQGQQLTSEPFNIVVEEPADIGVIPLAGLEGNKKGVFVSSVDPRLKLATLPYYNTIVGEPNQVTFLSATPDVPGLTFDPQSGMLSGIATSEFDGTVTISFVDDAGRPGEFALPVRIWPEPELTSAQTVYDVPRLNEARNLDIKVVGNSGFYQGVSKFGLEPGSDAYPSGIRLEPINSHTAIFAGSTTDPVGTVRNLIVRGESAANGLPAKFPITIRIVAPVAPKLEIPEGTELLYKVDGKTMILANTVSFDASSYLTGSYNKPVTWSLAGAPTWIRINPSSGVLYTSGNPSDLGKWPFAIVAKDADGTTVTAQIAAKVTLDGFIVSKTGGRNLTVRAGETFAMPVQTLDNVVGSYSFETNPILPSTIVFNSLDGSMLGYFEDGGVNSWKMQVTDADGRHFLGQGLDFSVTAVPPVDMQSPLSVGTTAKQYDPENPLTISFRPASNIMGSAAYVLSGDIPGTLYYKSVHPVTGLASYLNFDANGDSSVVDQMIEESVEQTEARLAPDHLIFDTESLVLTGIPSRFGSFDIYVTAYDDYKKTGYTVNPADPTREAHNESEYGPITVNVAKADDLQVANNLTSETLYQYTTTPTIVSATQNAAYGLPLTWTRVDGNLPTNIKPVGNTYAVDLKYSDYPQTKGSYGNITYLAKDAAGREVTTDPVSFTVVDRKPLELVTSTANPRYMIVFDQDANLRVTARNRAYGLPIGAAKWAVTGDTNLPPGVTYTVDDNGVSFTGKSDVIGTYENIIVSAVDSLGATASVNLTFEVISNPEEIVLNVSDITTKVGYPYTMATPFAGNVLSTANTYGSLYFASPDAGARGIGVNSNTGELIGTAAATGSFSINLSVTDDTNRITSKPITVDVLPDLRLLVSTQVHAEQGTSVNEPIATDYAIGTVTYVKGNPSAWPDGLNVDPATGTIIGSAIAATGTYPGLTIIGTDGVGDTQASNVFSVVVDPINAAPVIADITGGRLDLGKVGDAVSFKPTVTDSVKGQPWNYAGTVYSINHDLSAYGLSFNKATGEITGTATGSFLIKDVIITVTSQREDSDQTATFWLYVTPQGALAFVQPNVETANTHTNFAKKDVSIPVINGLGTVTLTTQSFAGGVASYNNSAQTVDILATTPGSRTLFVKATDEVGRTSTKQLDVITSTLSVAYTPGSAESGVDFTDVAPIVSNAFGSLKYAYSGLPEGLVYDEDTGIVTGNSEANVGTYSVTVTVTDQVDNATASATATMYLTGGGKFKYWKVIVTSSTQYAPRFNYFGKMHMYDVTGAVLTSATTVSVSSNQPSFYYKRSYGPDYLVSGGTDGYYFCAVSSVCTATVASMSNELIYTFATPVTVNSIISTSAGGAATPNELPNYRATDYQLWYSADGVDWGQSPITISKVFNAARAAVVTLTVQ